MINWKIPHLQLVTDRSQLSLNFLDMIEEALKSGINSLQLREKIITDEEFIQLGLKVKELTSFYRVPLLINDRISVVLAVDADGIHLGQSDMPYIQARNILGREKIIGLTVEHEDQIIIANNYQNIDYLGISAIFATPTKKDIQNVFGLQRTQQLKCLTTIPLIGIGGINEDNIEQVMDTKINGVAVVSAICSSTTPARATMKLQQKMKNYVPL